MSINENIKKIVLLRLPEKICEVWFIKPWVFPKTDQKQKDLGICLKTSEKKIAEGCYKNFRFEKANENGACIIAAIVKAVIRCHSYDLLNDEYTQYYNGENSPVSWLINNKYLKRYSKKKDFDKDRRNIDDYADITFEVGKNYYYFQNVETIYYRILIFLISEIIQNLRIEANLKSKQLNITKKGHFDIVYLKEVRMNKKTSFNSLYLTILKNND